MIEVVGEQLGVKEKSTVGMDSTFIEDLGADSLDTIELIMALESEFDVSGGDDTVPYNCTVEHLQLVLSTPRCIVKYRILEDLIIFQLQTMV